MKKQKQKKVQTQPIKQELDELNRQFDLLHEEIRYERKVGLPSVEELALLKVKAQKAADTIQKKIDKAKAHIKRRKQEIKQWKESFDRLEQEEKVERMNELQREIKWRAEDIASKEAVIAKSYFEKTDANAKIESLNIKEYVINEGYNYKDISEDPRLKAINDDREKLRKKLSTMLS